MPWYRNGHSIPVIYKTSMWWVDWSFNEDQEGFETWHEAINFALTTIHEEEKE